MRIAGLAAFVGMSIVALLMPSTPVAAADCKALVKPSPFGPDDQTGATNRVTPAVTKAAAAEIQTGVVTSMSNILVDMRADMALAEIGVLHIGQLVVAEFSTR